MANYGKGKKLIFDFISAGNPFPVNCIHTFINHHNIVDFYMETSELIKEAKQGSAAAQKCLFDQLVRKDAVGMPPLCEEFRRCGRVVTGWFL